MEREISIQREDKILEFIKFLRPYIILFVITFIACELLFYVGFPQGDDTTFHFANIYELYDSIKTNHSLSISHDLIQGLGYGKGLFYSPLAHLSVALIGIIFSPMNMSLLTAFKLTIFLSVYISGIFSYIFCKKIVKNKEVISLIVAIIFMISPYRLFCFYARNAFSEAYAIMYLPLFFMGLYDFTHIKDDNFNVKPFAKIIVGAILLYFSHNITALFSYLFGFIYILFFIKSVVKTMIKFKRYRIYSYVSVGIIVGLACLLLMTTLPLLRSNIYNVSNTTRMWTNREHVMSDFDRTNAFSGFLNISWLTSYTKGLYSAAVNFTETIYYLILTFVMFAFDEFLKKFKLFNKTHHLVSSLIYITLIYLIYKVGSKTEYSAYFRPETVSTGLILAIMYVIINSFKFDIKNDNVDTKTLYAYIFNTIFVLLLACCPVTWYIMPSVFYVIQFCWRVNCFIWLFVPLICAILMDKYGYKLSLVVITIFGIIPMYNQANFEKRLVNESLSSRTDSFDTNLGYPWKYTIDERYLDSSKAVGHNREYLPQIYYTYDGKYKSPYKNNLYFSVYSVLGKPSVDLNLCAIVCFGTGSVSNYQSDTPHITFDLTATSDVIVEVPLIYYSGYKVRVYDKNSGKATYINTLDPKDSDYLVGFSVKEGEYSIDINYYGSTGQNLGRNIFGLSILVFNMFVLYDSYYIYKKRYTYLF